MYDSNDIKNETEEEKTKASEIHRTVRGLRKNPEALDDLAIESFLRIVGIYFTIPEAVRCGDKFKNVSKQFEKLRNFIDGQLAADDGENFAKYDMADYVHNLQLLLVEIVDLDYLEANIHNVREEYRNHVGDITFRIYTLSKSFQFLDKYWHVDPTDPDFLQIRDIYEEKLRVDYGNLINEIRKARLYEGHIESTRKYLILKALNVLIYLAIIPLAIIIVYIVFFQDPKTLPFKKIDPAFFYLDISGLVLFCSAAIAGAAGSFISVVLRIQGVRDNTQLAQNIFAFKYSKTTVQVAPLTGMLFAILLCFIIFGGLIGGSMFPTIHTIPDKNKVLTIDPDAFSRVLNNVGELSKLLVWSFIAGFSERLIPDMVDRLADKARDADEKFTK
jgi:hypothetical protein